MIGDRRAWLEQDGLGIRIDRRHLLGQPTGAAPDFQIALAVSKLHVRSNTLGDAAKPLDIDAFTFPRPDVLVVLDANVGDVRIAIDKSAPATDNDHLSQTVLRSE